MTLVESSTGTCSLCKRDVPRHMITLHHLKPREKGGRAEHRTPLCRPCHKQLHALSSNAKLAKSFGRIDLLKTAPELQRSSVGSRTQARAELPHGPREWSPEAKTAVGFKQVFDKNIPAHKKAVPGKDGFEWGW